jgi:hypothetical protein
MAGIDPDNTGKARIIPDKLNKVRVISQRRKTDIDILLNLNSSVEQLRQATRDRDARLTAAADIVLKRYLAGELDTRGHEVEVRELVVARKLVKVLVIDGHVFS